MTQATKSKVYGRAQTLVFCLFSAAVLLSAKAPVVFQSPSAAIVGNALCAVGVTLMLTAVFTLRRVIQIAPNPVEGGELITRGVYGWFRHPIYTAIDSMVVGLFLRQPTLAAAAAAVLVIVFLVVKVRFEEALLAARYPGYAAYRQTSWGVFPGLRW